MATNRDKITNEQLATFIFDGTYKHCDYCILQGKCYSGRCENRGTCINNIVSWLEKEAELTADEMFEELGYKIDRIITTTNNL